MCPSHAEELNWYWTGDESKVVVGATALPVRPRRVDRESGAEMSARFRAREAQAKFWGKYYSASKSCKL